MKTKTTRLAALALALVLLLTPALSVRAEESGGAAASPEVILAGMTPVDKVAQMLMPTFRYIPGDDGRVAPMETLTEAAAACIADYGFAGLAVFTENAADTAKAVAYMDAAQKANAAHPTRLLIAADQEGGGATRLGHGTMLPGNMALGAANDLALTAKSAEIAGTETMSVGINMVAAPVMDVNSNPANPIIGIRAFSDDPATVIAQGTAFLRALQATGSIPIVKHFPGHGDTDVDSHTGLPLVDRSYEQLRDRELLPFAAAVEAGVEAIMTAHIQYPQIEKQTYISKSTGEEITLPATLSRTILTDILRGDLGYSGVIMTDAMEMSAIKTHFDPYDAAKLAISAGVDILLIPVDTTTPEGMESFRTYIRTLAGMVETGEISSDAVDAAVLRVLKLKAAHGLTEPYRSPDPAASAIVGCKAHHETEWEIAKKAVTLVKNDNNILPLTGAGEKTVVLTAYDNEVLSMEYAADLLRSEGLLAAGAEVSAYSIRNAAPEEAIALTEGADHVVLISELYSAKGLSSDFAAEQDAIIDAVHAAGGDVTVLSCSLPYDAARFPQADAVVLCYLARSMREDPRTVDGAPAEYGPNLPAALYLMLSPVESPSGTLPVNIPALDGDYRYTDELLYPRGFGLRYAGGIGDYSDLDGGAWYAESVDYALRRGIFEGTDRGVFAPEAPLTRAQLVTVLWRMAGKPAAEAAAPFTDVAEGSWYAEAVRWAASAGIVAGVSETAFAPDSPVSREQAAVLLYRNSGAEVPKGVMGLAGYTDSIDISDWARDGLLWATHTEIMQGAGGFLRPQDTLTRAEAAQLLYNLARRV